MLLFLPIVLDCNVILTPINLTHVAFLLIPYSKFLVLSMIWFLTHSVLSYSFNVLNFCCIVSFLCWTHCFLWKCIASFTLFSIFYCLVFAKVFGDTCKQVYKMPIVERWQSCQRRSVTWNILLENIMHAFSFMIVDLLIRYCRLMLPKEPANTHFHEERDKFNIELFFLANKKTDFFFQWKPFPQIAENLTLRGCFHAFYLSHHWHWSLDKLMLCYHRKQTHTSPIKFSYTNY